MSKPGRGQETPLFPLNTVLFPGGPLSLRIFEPRYLDMVSECLRSEQPFGVCLIAGGSEVGAPADTVAVGTLARIVDWSRLEDGLLGIGARGEGRFRVLERRTAENRLVLARVAELPAEPPSPLPPEHAPLAHLLEHVLEQVGRLYAGLPARYDDATWVGYRLAELLPLPLTRKQYFLELEDPLERLAQLAAVVAAIGEVQR